MTYRKLFALVGSVLMLMSVLGPGAAAAASAANQDAGNQGAGNLSIGVSQDGDDVTVTVTDDGDTVEGASVNVSSNDSYEGDGSYNTDENGTVRLDAPENDTNVTFTASYEGATATKTVLLTAVDEDEGDPNGAFGQEVTTFVHTLFEERNDDERGIGQMVSDFVKENNPGNGPPEHANGAADNGQGPPEDKGSDGDKGKPDHAGNDGDKGNNEDGGGPPDHAKNDDGDDAESEDEE